GRLARARLFQSRTAQGALRLGARGRLAGRTCRGIRGARGRHARLAAGRRKGLRLRSDVPPRRIRSYIRRDERGAETRIAPQGSGAVASRARVPQAGGGVSCALALSPTLPRRRGREQTGALS